MAKRIIICLTLVTVLAPFSFGADPAPGAEMQKPEWWVNAAIAIAEKVEDAAQKKKILREISHIALNAGMFDEARRIMGEADIDLVEAQLKRGMLAEALQTAKEIQYTGTKDSAIASIVRAQAGAKEFADALATVEFIYDSGLKMDVTIEIAAAEVNANDPGAREVLTRLLEGKGMYQGWYGKLKGILELQCRAGLFDDAKAATGKMPSPANRIEALGLIAEAQSAAGKRDDAMKTLADAGAVAESADKENPAWRLDRLAIAQAHLGMIKEAIATAGRVDLPRVTVYTAIAEAQFKAGDKDAALKTYSDAVESAEKYEGSAVEYALREIALSQIRCGLVAEGLQYAAKTRDRREVAYYALKKYIEMSKFSDATAIAETTGGVDFLMLIAKAQVEAGLREDAAKTYIKAAESAKQIRNYADHIGVVRFEREGHLLTIVQEQVDAGLMDDAIATAKELKDFSFKDAYRFPLDGQFDEGALINSRWPSGLVFASQAWCMIVLAQAKGGDFDQALGIAQIIPDITVRALAVCGIAERQAAAGKAEDAARNFGSAAALMKKEQKVIIAKYVRDLGASMARASAFESLASLMETLKDRPASVRVAFCLGAAEGLPQKQQEKAGTGP